MAQIYKAQLVSKSDCKMVQLQELIHSDSPSVRQWPGFKAVARDEFVLGASWERGRTCKGSRW
jgi:hypothetical protein